MNLSASDSTRFENLPFYSQIKAYTTKVYEDSDILITNTVVGPLDNNVYIIYCKNTSSSILVDAANEHDKLLELTKFFNVQKVVETHGHFDHIGAVSQMLDSNIDVLVSREDSSMLPGYDLIIGDTGVIKAGKVELIALHTPGHTPGSFCFKLNNYDIVLSGDTLFPGGPGATHLPGANFDQIITSITNRLFVLKDSTLVLPGHGRFTTIGDEKPHLDEWISRGW